MKDTGDFKIGPAFFPATVLVKIIKHRQVKRLAISLRSVEPPLAWSASRVAAKFERIRTIVMVRRNQRSDVCNEIRVVMDMDIPSMSAMLCMFILSGFDEEA
jgi:hypothetical protein